jgi:photosystem II stability/assembly factor-like uncharacterized protein
MATGLLGVLLASRLPRIVTVAGLAAAILSSGAARAGTWTSHGPTGGVVAALAVDPLASSTVYAATSGGGIFKSVDGGASWSPRPIPVPNLSGADVTAVAVDRVTPGLVYATSSSGIDGGFLVSTNGGAQWTFSPLGDLRAIAIDPATPSTLWVAGAQLYKSTDAGLTWTMPNANPGWFSIAIDPTAPNTVYVGGSGFVMKTIDGGEHWTFPGSADLPNGSPIQTIVVDPTAPGTVWAGAVFGIYKSVDGGDHWTSTGPAVGEFGQIVANQLVLDPVDTHVVYVAGLALDGVGVYKSTDGGATWAPTPVLPGGLSLAMLSSSTLVAGTPEGIFRTGDAATTWDLSNDGLVNTSVVSIAVDTAAPGTVYSGTLRGVVARSVDGGDTWTPTAPCDPFGNGVVALAVDPTASATVYAGDGGIRGSFKTIDAGASWASLEGAPIDGLALALDPTDSSVVFLGAFGGFFRSPDGGATWTPMNEGISPPIVLSIAVDPTSPGTIYAGTVFGVYKTIDGAAHWSPVDVGLPPMDHEQDVPSLALDPTNSSILYAAVGDNFFNTTVFKSTDAGATWSPANTGITSTAVSSVVADAVVTGSVYVGTRDAGVFVTVDGGATWAPTNDGIFNPDVRSLAAEPGRVYAGTAGSGTFVMSVPSTTTTSTTTTSSTSTTTLAPAVLGRAFSVKDPKPGDPSKRRIVATAKEPASDDVFDAATLVANGASLTITTFGANPTGQTFPMPAPWTPIGTTGARYADKHGQNGPVKSAVVKRSGSGVFEIRVSIAGALDDGEPTVIVVPPNPGAGAKLVLQVAGGASYCVGFGDAAGGQVANKGDVAFKVSRPTAAFCP